jgi:hypothetical protein
MLVDGKLREVGVFWGREKEGGCMARRLRMLRMRKISNVTPCTLNTIAKVKVKKTGKINMSSHTVNPVESLAHIWLLNACTSTTPPAATAMKEMTARRIETKATYLRRLRFNKGSMLCPYPIPI